MRSLILCLSLLSFSKLVFAQQNPQHKNQATNQEQVVSGYVVDIEWTDGEAWVRLEIDGVRKMFTINSSMSSEQIKLLESALSSQKEIKLKISGTGRLKSIVAVVQ